MRWIALLTVVAAGLVAAESATAGPNAGWCWAVADNYNKCIDRQHRQARMDREREWGWGEPEEYGYGRYGYGHRPRRRSEDCGQMLLQMKAMGCW